MPTTVRTCMNCNGNGKTWNPQTKKNDVKCFACNGKGVIIVQTI